MDRTEQAVRVFDKHAQAYRDKFMDTSMYREPLDLFCSSVIQEQAAILDIACGPGNIAQYLLTKRPDLRILGIDLAPAMIREAIMANPTAEFRIMDARNVADLQQQFDGITCGFCLPYLDPEETEKLIKDVFASLRPGGIFYVSTIEDDPSKSGIERSGSGDEVYMYYYLAEQLERYLHSAGFRICDSRGVSYLGRNEQQVTDVVIVGEKPDGS